MAPPVSMKRVTRTKALPRTPSCRGAVGRLVGPLGASVVGVQCGTSAYALRRSDRRPQALATHSPAQAGGRDSTAGKWVTVRALGRVTCGNCMPIQSSAQPP